MEPGLQHSRFHLPWDTGRRKRPREGTGMVGGAGEETGCCSAAGAGNKTPSVSTYLTGDFLMPRSALRPIKSLIQTQVIQKQTSNSSASGFDCEPVPRGVRLLCSSPGRVPRAGAGGRGKTLTLGTDGPLPAFFAHTGEGLAVDHAGAPIMAGVGQTATIPGYKTRADKTTLTF